MPTYVYELRDAVTGEVLGQIEALRPIERRDAVTVRRAQVPETLAVAGAVKLPSFEDELKAGWNDLEHRQGARINASEFGGLSGVERILSTPTHDAA